MNKLMKTDPMALAGEEWVSPGKIREALGEGPFWVFRQNNSGGRFEPPGIEVVIRADDEEEAWGKLRRQPGYTDRYCSCCGKRWYSPSETSANEVVSLLMAYAQEARRKGRGEERGSSFGALSLDFAESDKVPAVTLILS